MFGAAVDPRARATRLSRQA